MAAEKPFDPYHLWLGIAPEHQPPNHYLLLGIGLFEHDDEVIEQAAERQSAYVRTFLSTPEAAQAKSLLNKIRLASDCLHTPELKARYDAALKTQLAGRAATAAEDSTAVIPAAVNPSAGRPVPADQPPAATESGTAPSATWQAATERSPIGDFAPSVQQSARRRKPVRRPATPWALIVGGVLAGVLVLGGAIAWLNRGAPSAETGASSSPLPIARRDQPTTSDSHDSKPNSPTYAGVEPTESPPVQPLAAKVTPAEPRPESGHAAATTGLEFNGQDQYIDLRNPPDLNFSGQITLAAWVRPQERMGIHNIVAHGLCAQPAAELFLRTNDGRYETGCWNGHNHHTDFTIPPSDFGTWVHLTGMYDGKKWKLFRNGILVNEKPDETGAIAVNESWAIAAAGNGKDRHFHGGLADVRIYRRGLSDDEVHALFSRPVGDSPDYDDPLSKGLVGNWALASVAEPAVDRSAAGQDGKLVGRPRRIAGPQGNAAGQAPPARVAAAVKALDFDGKTQYVALGNPAELNFAGPITLAAWIKPADITSAGYQDIVGHDFAISPPAAVYLRISQGRYEVGSWMGKENFSAAAPIPSTDLNHWVQLTGLYDGTRWKLFRNGLRVAETTTEHGAMPVNERWSIGALGNGKERHFHGGLADVRIYRRGLSDDEVRELFARSTGTAPIVENKLADDDRLSDGLVANWALESVSDPVIDRSAGGHKGKLVGRPRSIAGPPEDRSGQTQLVRTEPDVTPPAVKPPNPKQTETPTTQQPNPASVVITGPRPPNPGLVANVPAPRADTSSEGEFVLVKRLATRGWLTAFSPDGQWVASGGKGTPELLELHNVATGKKTVLIDQQHAFIRNLAFTGNSRQLAAVDSSGVVTFWDLPGGGLARTVPAPDRSLDGHQFGSDARTVVLICFNPASVAVIADTQTGAELFRVRSPYEHMKLIEASPNGRYMLLGGYEIINGRTGPMRLTLFDLKTGRENGSFPESPAGGQFWNVTFSPDSNRIAMTTLGHGDRVTIWNVPGRRIERELVLKSPTGGQPNAWAKTFTNDSRQLLTVGNDRTFCLWDVSSGELRAFHRSEYTGIYKFLDFAADGRTFCAANESGNAEVWQMRVSLPKAAAPAARLAPPSRDQQAAVQQLVKEAFADEFAKAKKPADKAELARKLLTRASDAADANERYVILEHARDLAATAGEAAVLCQAIDTLTATYAVDPLPLATAGLELLPRGGTATNQADLAEGLAAIAESWAARGDWDAAAKLAVQAAAAARKAKNPELSKSLARLQTRWKETARSAETLRADEATLAANPDDPAANLSVGKHYARLDDWARALPLLAKAADENLQRLAADELKASDDPQQRLRLADAWYDFAGAQPRKEQPLFLSHAAELYRQAAPGLKGLVRTKAQKRIDEIEAAGGE
jgi:hypothetical protein